MFCQRVWPENLSLLAVSIIPQVWQTSEEVGILQDNLLQNPSALCNIHYKYQPQLSRPPLSRHPPSSSHIYPSSEGVMPLLGNRQCQPYQINISFISLHLPIMPLLILLCWRICLSACFPSFRDPGPGSIMPALALTYIPHLKPIL